MDDVSVSVDARRRIDSARVRQMTFEVKKIYPKVSAEDAEMLAAVILEVVDAGGKLDGASVRSALRSRGRSADAAERLASMMGL